MTFPRSFSDVARCRASKTGWVEIAEEVVESNDDLSFIGRMTAADLLVNPYIRQLSAEGAAEAERVEMEQQA